MKNNLYCASTTLNLCPISIAKMCFVHFRYMYNCRRTCHATMGPQVSWSSIACFYYRILRFMPGPSDGPKLLWMISRRLWIIQFCFEWRVFFRLNNMFWTWIKKQNCILKCHFLVQSKKFWFLAQISIATSKKIWSHCIRFYCAKKIALSGCRSVDVQKAKHVSTIQWHLFSNKVKEKLTFWPTL